MKRVISYAFLFWLTVITSVYSYTAVKWLQNPFNKSPYDYWFSLLVGGVVATVSVVVMILGKRSYIVPLILGSLLAISFIVMSILSKSIADLLVFLWILILGWVIGRKIVGLMCKDLPVSWLEKGIFSIAIGFGFYSFLILGLALSGFLYREVVFAVLILISIMLIKDSAWLLAEGLAGIKNLPSLFRNESNTGFVSALISIILISILINFIGAIAPEIQYDSLNYHLNVPKIYIENHKIVNLPHIFQSYFAKSIEMLYALSLILSGQIVAKLFSLSFGVLTTVAIIAFGKRFFSFETGIVAAALFYVSPLVGWLSTTTYIDLAVTFYIFSALYAMVLWWKMNSKGLLLTCGLISGLALSAKLNAALALVPISLSVVVISYHLSGKSLSRNVSHLAIFGLLILTIAVPWYMITYLHTGNPVFPFYNALFKSPLLPYENTFMNLKNFGMGYGLKDFFLLPWNITYRSNAFMEATPDGFIGIALLLSLPSIFFMRSSKIVVILVLVSAVFVTFWFNIAQYLRYFLLILPPLSIIAAYCYCNFKQTSWGFSRHMHSLAIVIALISSFPLLFVSFWNIPERIPYKRALGIESVDEYLSRTLRGYYQTFKYLERNYHNQSEVKILLVGDSFHYYSKFHIEKVITSLNTRELLEFPPGDRLLNALLKKGFTHILIDEPQLSHSNYKPSVTDEYFLKNNTKLEFAAQNIAFYKILKEGAALKEDIHQELLENPGFEKVGKSIPFGWNIFGNPVFDYSGRESRTGKGAVKSSKNDFFTQRVVIEEWKLYTIAHCTRAEKDNQFARLQVNWLAHDKIARADIKVIPAQKDKWTCNAMSLTAPEEAKIADIYASVHEDSEIWFDDFSFVQGVK